MRKENKYSGTKLYMMKRLVGIKELSKYLDIKVNTVYGWVSMRQIPHYKIGRLIKFDINEIDKWLQNKKQNVVDLKKITKEICSI